jgi:hypothetical protein
MSNYPRFSPINELTLEQMVEERTSLLEAKDILARNRHSVVYIESRLEDLNKELKENGYLVNEVDSFLNYEYIGKWKNMSKERFEKLSKWELPNEKD